MSRIILAIGQLSTDPRGANCAIGSAIGRLSWATAEGSHRGDDHAAAADSSRPLPHARRDSVVRYLVTGRQGNGKAGWNQQMGAPGAMDQILQGRLGHVRGSANQIGLINGRSGAGRVTRAFAVLPTLLPVSPTQPRTNHRVVCLWRGSGEEAFCLLPSYISSKPVRTFAMPAAGARPPGSACRPSCRGGRRKPRPPPIADSPSDPVGEGENGVWGSAKGHRRRRGHPEDGEPDPIDNP